MKWCSTSTVIREMQINPHLLEWLKFGALTTPNAGKDVEQKSFIAGGNTEWNSHAGEPIGRFIKKLHTQWPLTQDFYFLVSPWTNQNECSCKTCTWMSIVVISQTRDSPDDLHWGSGWMNTLCYIQMVEYYSVVKRIELILTTTGVNLRCILVNERGQTQRFHPI